MEPNACSVGDPSVTMPTTELSPSPTPLPSNGAVPKLNRPPSTPLNQYPPPSGMAAMATIGWARWMAPAEPKNPASPK